MRKQIGNMLGSDGQIIKTNIKELRKMTGEKIKQIGKRLKLIKN